MQSFGHRRHVGTRKSPAKRRLHKIVQSGGRRAEERRARCRQPPPMPTAKDRSPCRCRRPIARSEPKATPTRRWSTRASWPSCRCRTSGPVESPPAATGPVIQRNRASRVESPRRRIQPPRPPWPHKPHYADCVCRAARAAGSPRPAASATKTSPDLPPPRLVMRRATRRERRCRRPFGR